MTEHTANAPGCPQEGAENIHRRGFKLSNVSSIAGALIPSVEPVSNTSTKLWTTDLPTGGLSSLGPTADNG
ncbi:hypothetical protein PHLGIDRAFT_114873 [Phlebiopsis gigantea 11061_1 CR5-6]|uniref:Uncharacterized protein n=1 Tax=Phlebiopsis gigantea (strain 11061_1 CR5-6) TaxID=745531 RepID=A0A0C3P0D6_PHLG1|nr:hypothetical protein PHLGIDRAFT_114873 [Phlebiopsis gigantea 11061_1 CR5-6]